MEPQSRFSMRQFNTSPSFNGKRNPEIHKPTSPASEPISIRTDVPQPNRCADMMPSDVPDLTYDYDHGFTTPNSASSSYMIPTPVYDWTMPLADELLDGKCSYRPLLEDWPPNPTLSGPYYTSAFSSPSQSTHSSPTISRSCAFDDVLDELNWEKQRYSPLSSSCVETGHTVSNAKALMDPGPQHSQSGVSYCASTHTLRPHDASAYTHYDHPEHPPSSSSHNFDTPCNSFGHSSAPFTSSNSATSFCNTISPSALTSSSSTSPPIVMQPPPPQPPVQPPLKLHQPRPSRRIPIISLAQLASAGEQQHTKSHSSKTKHARGVAPPGHPYPRTSPVEALSPLPLDCHGFSPISPKREISQLSTSKMNSFQHSRPSHLPNPTHSGRLRQASKIIKCSCGCMESYTIRQ